MARGRANARGIRGEVVVADDLDASAGSARESDPAVAIVFGQWILDRSDRITIDPVEQHFDHSVAVQFAALEPEPVTPVATELGGRDVERDRDVGSGHEPRALDGAHEHGKGLFVGRERRPPSAFVGHARKLAGVAHQLSGDAIDLGRHLERVGERSRAHGQHHEILDVDPPSRVRAAAKYLDLGQRQRDRVAGGQVAPQGQAARGGRGVRHCE